MAKKKREKESCGQLEEREKAVAKEKREREICGKEEERERKKCGKGVIVIS